MTEQEELINFIRMRLDEVNRLSRMMSASVDLSMQSGTDQLDRLSNAVFEVVTFIQYFENQPTAPEKWLHGPPLSPLSIPILKKIANNWSYHSDFNPDWKSNNAK